MRSQKLWCPVYDSCIHSDFDEIKYVAQPVGLLRLMLNLFCTINIQRGEFS